MISHEKIILAVILLSYAMIVLDTSIVLTALPSIQQDFGLSPIGLSWVANAYTLTFGGLLLLGARAGDLLGRRRMFIAGLVVFALSSLVIGLSTSEAVIITARAIQGLGAAILAPSTLALLQVNFFEGKSRARAISLHAATAGISASFGLVIGGFLADWPSWRVGFFINVPLAIFLILAARKYIKETPTHRGKFDLAGAITSTLGIGGIVLSTVWSAMTGWHDPYVLAALIAGLGFSVSFVIIESRAAQPIMPLRLFASRQRSGAYAVRFLFLGANMGFFFYSTQFMQDVLSLSPTQTGLAFLPAMLANFIMALNVPKLIRRFGSHNVLPFSIGTAFVGMALLSFLDVSSNYIVGMALPMILVGIGQGATLAPLTTFGVKGVEPRDAGAASGLINAAHQTGCSVGLAILVMVSFTGPPLSGEKVALSQQVAYAMLGSSGFLILALILTLTLIRRGAKDIELQAAR